jgi:predicted DCC family thiol-disulfide oxidoreductase YuxK
MAPVIPTTSTGTADAVLVLYDRDCGFCAWTLAWVLRWDRAQRLRPAPIQGPEGDTWLARMPAESRLASWHTVDEHGRVLSAGAALSAVLRRLPGGAPLAALTRAAAPVTERGYAAVAKGRPRLSRLIPARAKSRAWELIAERQGRSVEQVAPQGSAGSCAVEPRS